MKYEIELLVGNKKLHSNPSTIKNTLWKESQKFKFLSQAYPFSKSDVGQKNASHEAIKGVGAFYDTKHCVTTVE
jgi:hypothetical protein